MNRTLNMKKPIDELKDRQKLERGQTMSEYAVVLTVISGTSVLLFSGLATKVETVVLGVVRLLP
jgi:Flp pilus assembly pilin Flp